MGESDFGREDSRGDWSPDKPISYGPLFAWPPKPRALVTWFFGIPGYLLPWNLAYAIAAVGIWFFLTPIIYPISLIGDESVRNYSLFNPMHNFVSLYREIVLLGEISHLNLFIITPISFCTYVFGGWFFLRIKHAFGDVL